MTTSDDFTIIPVTDNIEKYKGSLTGACDLHRSFRENLPKDYEQYMIRMFEEDAEMVVGVVEGTVKSLAVYRCHHTTFHGLRFYVDDLVSLESARGNGYGRRILAWCEHRARERKCDFLDLESGVGRPRTHKFYFREGLEIFAFGFSKSLR